MRAAVRARRTAWNEDDVIGRLRKLKRAERRQRAGAVGRQLTDGVIVVDVR